MKGAREEKSRESLGLGRQLQHLVFGDHPTLQSGWGGMSSGEIPEGRQQQPMIDLVEAKTGQSHAIGALPQERHGMEMAADVQQSLCWRSFRFMAEPPGPKLKGGLRPKGGEDGSAIMVSADQDQFAAHQFGES